MNALGLLLAVVSRAVFSFTDPAIEESSGLVDLGALMVTTNDSGDDAVVYAIDPRTGETVGRTTYAAAVEDVEALAPAGTGEVWAADIGDNTETRRVVEVYRVPVGRGDREVDAPSYRLLYPDGPHDAESLIAPGGRLYVITKDLLGGTVYAAPVRLDPNGPNRLTAVGSVSVWATDAAMFGPGHVLVRGYGTAEVLSFPGFESLATFDLPEQEQGEGISVGPDGRVRLSSEGRNATVLQISLPLNARTALEPEPVPTPTPSVSVVPDGPERDTEGGSDLRSIAIGAGGVAVVVVTLWWIRRRL